MMCADIRCYVLTCNCSAGEASEAAKSQFAAWDLAATRTAVASQINTATSHRGVAAYTVEASHCGKLAVAASAVLIDAPCNITVQTYCLRYTIGSTQSEHEHLDRHRFAKCKIRQQPDTYMAPQERLCVRKHIQAL